jgi:hypothetical protein
VRENEAGIENMLLMHPRFHNVGQVAGAFLNPRHLISIK